MQQYVVMSRKNPLKPDEQPKYYALAHGMRTVDLDAICQRISERSSYSLGELEGTIGEFLLEIQNILKEGNIAQVGKLGRFRLTLRTYRPTSTPDDFSNSHVKSCRVLFHPSTKLVEMCKTVKFTPYKSDAEESEEPAEQPKA